MVVSAIRKEFTRRSQADSAQWKVKMSEAAEELEDQRETQKAVSAGMTLIVLFEYYNYK